MRRFAAAALALATLASCPRAERGAVTLAAPDLETAAVLRGLVADPRTSDPVGLYGRDTDRMCVVRDGSRYRVGVYVDYGEGLGCDASGSLRRSGERLSFDLGGGCAFDAVFDGAWIVFPISLPTACAARCTRRATFSALSVDRLSEAPAEAAAMRSARGGLPCG